eukprot:scaffold3485_cov259-Chaetoceros_neogracile.AAC.5
MPPHYKRKPITLTFTIRLGNVPLALMFEEGVYVVLMADGNDRFDGWGIGCLCVYDDFTTKAVVAKEREQKKGAEKKSKNNLTFLFPLISAALEFSLQTSKGQH